MENMRLLTGRDENQLMVYDRDGKKPRVLFKILNGQVSVTEKVSSSQAIPSKYHFHPSLVHR